MYYRLAAIMGLLCSSSKLSLQQRRTTPTTQYLVGPQGHARSSHTTMTTYRVRRRVTQTYTASQPLSVLSIAQSLTSQP
jgi:hypothetical protein